MVQIRDVAPLEVYGYSSRRISAIHVWLQAAKC